MLAICGTLSCGSDGGAGTVAGHSGNSGSVGSGGQSSGGDVSSVSGGATGSNGPLAGTGGADVRTGGSAPVLVSTTGGAGNVASASGGSPPSSASGGTSPGTGTGGIGGTPGPSGTAGTGVPAGPVPATSAATRMKCTGTSPIHCDFGGAVGNYDVTVVLGGDVAGNTIAQAELGRVMLPTVITAAGETKKFSFSVNVRQPEGEPIQMRPTTGTPGLDVYFTGTAPQLKEIGYAPATSPFMIYIAGDSTVCDQPAGLGGWGQSLPQFFDFPVSVANYADSGESSGSFLNSGSLFGAITSRLKPGDWVFIQLGHNDKTVSAQTFHDNMTKLVTGTVAKGGFPLLFSPISRAQFNGATLGPQHINSTGANLPEIVKQVAMEQKVPFIDLTAKTTTWLNSVGPNGYQAFFGGGQVTHTNVAGANVIAGLVRDGINELAITALTAHLRAP